MSTRVARRLLEKRAEKERSLIQPALVELRKKAESEIGKPQRLIVAGWSLILSVGLLDSFGAEQSKPTDCDPIFPLPCDGKCRKTHNHYHLSARPNPHTRSTVDGDWINIGHVMRVLDIPEDRIAATIPQIADNQHVATRAIHWHWNVAFN